MTEAANQLLFGDIDHGGVVVAKEKGCRRTVRSVFSTRSCGLA
jgi:hypothetical protein